MNPRLDCFIRCPEQSCIQARYPLLVSKTRSRDGSRFFSSTPNLSPVYRTSRGNIKKKKKVDLTLSLLCAIKFKQLPAHCRKAIALIGCTLLVHFNGTKREFIFTVLITLRRAPFTRRLFPRYRVAGISRINHELTTPSRPNSNL